MMKTYVVRALYEKRWFVVGWGIAFSVMSSLIIMFYPSFSQGGGFDEVAKSMPSQLQGFIGDPSVFATLSGFIASQIYDVRMSLLIIIMTLVLATSMTVREEEGGDMRTLLSTSLGRVRLVVEKSIVALIIIVALNLITIAGIYTGIIALGETAPHELMWKLGALSCLFSFATFTIPFSTALMTGKRSITMIVGLFVALGSYLLSTFARTVDWLENWERLSIIHYFDTAGVRTGEFHVSNVVVLLGISLLILFVSTLVFRKRDIS